MTLCPDTTRLEATATLRSMHLLGSVHLSHQTSKAILSPDFPFALKGRSYDCQPQSSDPDLGVYLFLLEANFYALSHPHRRGKKSPLQGHIPPQPLALCSSIPQAQLCDIFPRLSWSSLTFLHPAESFSAPHILAHV